MRKRKIISGIAFWCALLGSCLYVCAGESGRNVPQPEYQSEGQANPQPEYQDKALPGQEDETRAGQDPEQDQEAVIEEYYAYLKRFEEIDTVEAITEKGFTVIENQVFPVQLKSYGEEELVFIPAIEEKLQRLSIFLADQEGNIVFRTDQLEANHRIPGALVQPVHGIAAVSFQDVDGDGRKDIIFIATCVNETGEYAGKPYKIGDVLFQGEGTFYRDYRVSDKINRFSMNKSIEVITAYVRDGKSTEFLYTATTLTELLKHDFQIIKEQCYTRKFEKQGKLTVVPGTIRIAEYDVFMIYLVNEQDRIVWSFQPMGEYDNLYSLKGMACKDLDGDGMKDLAVLARYSYEGQDGELLIDHQCAVYYQRTSGFDVDKEFCESYRCTEKDTMEAMVTKIREFWGWKVEND